MPGERYKTRDECHNEIKTIGVSPIVDRVPRRNAAVLRKPSVSPSRPSPPPSPPARPPPPAVPVRRRDAGTIIAALYPPSEISPGVFTVCTPARDALSAIRMNVY